MGGRNPSTWFLSCWVCISRKLDGKPRCLCPGTLIWDVGLPPNGGLTHCTIKPTPQVDFLMFLTPLPHSQCSGRHNIKYFPILHLIASSTFFDAIICIPLPPKSSRNHCAGTRLTWDGESGEKISVDPEVPLSWETLKTSWKTAVCFVEKSSDQSTHLP